MKKIMSMFLGLCLLAVPSFAKAKIQFDKSKVEKDKGSVKINDVKWEDLVADCGAGWNLGNSLDATGSSGLSTEMSWGMPKTTRAMIDGIAESGIKTIRIPVSWSKHMVDRSYTIDPRWMARVKEIVDWAIEDGMYVIINIHHDNFASPVGLSAGKGYYPDENNFKISEEYVANIWTQIAQTFNGSYDEHLIFETLNEPRLRNNPNEWTFNANIPDTAASAKIINKLNQAAVDAIRSTGGNNKKRFIMVPGYAASPESVLSDAFVVPKDSAKNKILISVHMYTPYVFAGQAPGTSVFSPKIQAEFAGTFKRLNDKFVKNGTGVVIGEYGAVNKNNLDQRVAYFHAYIKYARVNQLVAVLWDNGNWFVEEGSKDFSEKFGYYDRKTQEWIFPEILEAILEELQ